MEDLTIDTLFDGRIQISQNKNGYRFSVDPVILAHFVNPGPGSRLLDLGTGCGVIPLILAHRQADLRITGVELQTSLYRLAIENVSNNDMGGIIDIVQADMTDYPNTYSGELFDFVVTNPPYIKKNAGRINPDSERAIARHEIHITLIGIIRTASGLLHDKGEFAIIFPEGRLSELLTEMIAENLYPEKIRLVYTNKAGDAKLVLVSGRKNFRTPQMKESPLRIFDAYGRYTPEMEKMFR